MAACAAAITAGGVGKSGSPISMWITLRPAASRARAAVCTSIAWKAVSYPTMPLSPTAAARPVTQAPRRAKAVLRRAPVLIGAPLAPLAPLARLALLALLALLAAPPAVATVYKCLQDDGQVFYQ